MVADLCETTAEKQALCNDFCLALCLLLPVLLPPPAGTIQRILPKVIKHFSFFFVIVDDVL
jgi:hypothetical protein